MLGEPSPNKLIWPSFKTIFVLNCVLEDLYLGSPLSDKIGCGTLRQIDQEEVRECHVGRDCRWRYGTLLTCTSKKEVRYPSLYPWYIYCCIDEQKKIVVIPHSPAPAALYLKIFYEQLSCRNGPASHTHHLQTLQCEQDSGSEQYYDISP
jgi:hypothetical protein